MKPSSMRSHTGIRALKHSSWLRAVSLGFIYSRAKSERAKKIDCWHIGVNCVSQPTHHEASRRRWNEWSAYKCNLPAKGTTNHCAVELKCVFVFSVNLITSFEIYYNEPTCTRIPNARAELFSCNIISFKMSHLCHGISVIFNHLE